MVRKFVEHEQKDRAEGNPMFAEELALRLRDLGVLEVVNRECRLA